MAAQGHGPSGRIFFFLLTIEAAEQRGRAHSPLEFEKPVGVSPVLLWSPGKIPACAFDETRQNCFVGNGKPVTDSLACKFQMITS